MTSNRLCTATLLDAQHERHSVGQNLASAVDGTLQKTSNGTSSDFVRPTGRGISQFSRCYVAIRLQRQATEQKLIRLNEVKKFMENLDAFFLPNVFGIHLFFTCNLSSIAVAPSSIISLSISSYTAVS